MYCNVEPVGIEFGLGGNQPTEGVSQPTNPVLLLTTPISGDPLNNTIIEALDSTFGEGLDLHEGKL